MNGGQKQYSGRILVEYIQPFVLVGTHTRSHSPVVFAPRRPLEQRAEMLSGDPLHRVSPPRDRQYNPWLRDACPIFNLIEQAENTAQIHSNAMAYWSLVQQERVTAQKHARDTMTGRRSVEADVQGGEKPHAAPLEHTDKLAR